MNSAVDSRAREALAAGARQGARYELRLAQRGATNRAGSGAGRTAGSSVDFHDFRDYQPGDDLRRIDWNAYGRSDRLTVRLYREETQPHVELLLDGSRSMALSGTPKAEAALRVAAAVAAASSNSACSHAAWWAGDAVRPIGNGRAAPESWEVPAFAGREHVESVLQRQPPAWRPRSIRVLVSDLMWMGNPLATLQRLGEGAAAVAVVQVLAREDWEPSARGNLRLVDSESGRIAELFLDAVAGRRYQEAMARHRNHWFEACRQVGAILAMVVADEVSGADGLRPLAEAGILD